MDFEQIYKDFMALARVEELKVNVHVLGTNGEEGNDLGGTFGSRAMTGLVDTKAPVQCDPGIMERMEEICKHNGSSFRRMPRGATHDGNAMAMKMPIAMVFVPSRDGISHNKNEYTGWDQIQKGMTVFYETLASINETAGISKV